MCGFRLVGAGSEMPLRGVEGASAGGQKTRGGLIVSHVGTSFVFRREVVVHQLMDEKNSHEAVADHVQAMVDPKSIIHVSGSQTHIHTEID